MAITRWRCDCMALVEGKQCLGCGETRSFGLSDAEKADLLRLRTAKVRNGRPPRLRPELIHPATEDHQRVRTTPAYGSRSAVLEWGPDGESVSAYEQLLESFAETREDRTA